MQLIMFAKHLKAFDIPSLAEKAAAFGIDGYDYPVREGYAVNPDNVSTALPELARAMASEGLSVPMCTGEGTLTDPDMPGAEPLMAAMAEAGVKFLKLGYFHFKDTHADYWQAVNHARQKLSGWEKLAEKHNVTVCYHTHSGPYLGCTAAALTHLLHDFNPKYIGAYLDAGHLAAAGEEFPMACAMVGEYLKLVAVKDMKKVWVEVDGKMIVTRKQFPLGEAVLNPDDVFRHLVTIGFNGPVSIHIEHGDTPPEKLIELGQNEAQTYRSLLKAAEAEANT